MNNTFNINRFGKVLSLDFQKYYRNFGITLAILCGLTLVFWLLTLIFNFTMPALARWGLISVAMSLAIIMVPAKAFGDINLPREGVRFAMLPASNLEKYLSYVFYCLLTPVICFLLSWGIDSLLTALPFGGFNHYIKGFGFFDMLKNLFMEIDPNEITTNPEYYAQIQQIMDRFGSTALYNTIISVIFNIGIFMLGNLLFKTHKTVKTFACMIGIGYLFTLIIQVFFVSRGIFPWIIRAQGNTASLSLDFETITNYAKNAMLVSSVFRTVLTLGLYIGLFFKLKTQKY